jgi:hypothetical protein
VAKTVVGSRKQAAANKHPPFSISTPMLTSTANSMCHGDNLYHHWNTVVFF